MSGSNTMAVSVIPLKSGLSGFQQTTGLIVSYQMIAKLTMILLWVRLTQRIGMLRALLQLSIAEHLLSTGGSLLKQLTTDTTPMNIDGTVNN